MPLGSSSEALVINPGPSFRRRDPSLALRGADREMAVEQCPVRNGEIAPVQRFWIGESVTFATGSC